MAMKNNLKSTISNKYSKNNFLEFNLISSLKILATTIPLLLCGSVLGQQGIQANIEKKVDKDLPGLKAQTRQMIESVQADQPGSLDFVNGLGTKLSPKQLKLRRDLWTQRNVDNQSLSSSSQIELGALSSDQAVKLQWPSLSVPNEKRLLKRPDNKPEIDNGKPVFTPDFSRQRLTLASLAGFAVVDLPAQYLGKSDGKLDQSTSTKDDLISINLPDLVGLGLTYSPVMDQVQAQLESAISKAKQSRADLLPRASVRYSTGAENSENATLGLNKHTTTSASIRITQPLVNLPLISDWLAELKGEEAANWRLQATRETVALSVTQATVNLATARITLDYSDEQLTQFTKLLDYVQERAKTGVSSGADLERTRTRVLLAQQIRIELQAQYKNALIEIFRLTGQSPDALQLPYLNQLPPLPATQGELRRIAWDFSNDLRALRAEIESQRQVLSSYNNKLLPVLGMSIEHDSGKNTRGINPRQTDSRVMAVMSWDMSLGGKELYAANSAASELSNRQAKLTEEGERMLQSIDADFASLQSATLRVTAGQAEQLASAAVVDSVTAQLRTGRMGSLLEALDAYERHFAARQRLVSTLGQQMQAQAQLLRRIGKLSDLSDQAKLEFNPKKQVTKQILTIDSLTNTSVSPSDIKSITDSTIKNENSNKSLIEGNEKPDFKMNEVPVVITPI